MKNNIYRRVSILENEVSRKKSEQMETYMRSYKNACEEKNAEKAALFARLIRNKLLSETDKQMSIDRLGLDISSVTKLISSLYAVFNGDWAVYRQALRELPAQEGFPFNIVFPVPPEENDNMLSQISYI